MLFKEIMAVKKIPRIYSNSCSPEVNYDGLTRSSCGSE